MTAAPENDIDSLACMVAEGFREIGSDIKVLKQDVMHISDKLDGAIGRIDATNKRIDETNYRISEINHRIETIVIPLLDDHAHRIKNLELTR